MEVDTAHQVYDQELDIPFERICVVAGGMNGLVEAVKGTAGPFQGQIYARKVLRTRKESDVQKRVVRQIKDFKKVRHDHIVSIVTTYSFGGLYALIMDPCADTNLSNYLAMDDPPPNKEAIGSWYGCLMNGLAFLHNMGISHESIQPSHVLIKESTVLLTCVPRTSLQDKIIETMSRMTTSRPYIPLWAAPEVRRGFRGGAEGDIFSLGMVFVDMLIIGWYPEKEEELTRDLQSSSLQKHSERVAMVSKWMDTLIQRPDKLPWHETIAGLRVDMLTYDASARPKAGDIRLWWSYQSPAMLPPTTCKCNRVPSETDHWSRASIKDALKKTREKDYTMSTELLSRELAKLPSEKGFSAFKKWF